jgi:hypothetical protein
MEGSAGLTVSERADALEFKLMEELNAYATKSVLYVSGEVDPTNLKGNASAVLNQRPGATMLIGPAAEEDAGAPDLAGFLPAALRLDQPCAAERQACPSQWLR